ncbi:HU family DNA-binding protein [Candidatus Falkowbacteria bacterium]|nr:HU family DNA-binding protein [Candidatus Falkowbacteria bacterium]
MNKDKLAAIIAEKCNVTKKQAEDALDCFVETTMNTIKAGDEVTLTGFGTFSARTRKGRVGVNPQKTSEPITIPDTLVVKFKAGQRLKKYLKTKKATAPTTMQPSL